MDDALEMIDRHSANYQRRAADLAKQYAGGKNYYRFKRRRDFGRKPSNGFKDD